MSVTLIAGSYQTASGKATSPTDEPLIGFSGATSALMEQRFRPEILQRMDELGARLEHQYGSWSRIENDKGRYNWQPIDQWYADSLKSNLKTSIYIGPIDMNPPASMPADLIGKKFDDPIVLKRFKLFLDKFMDRYPEINYLGLGNEVNTYFRLRPAEADSYLRFLRIATKYIRGRYPRVRVYAIIMASDLKSADIVFARRVRRATDLIAFTYYKPVFYALNKGKLPIKTIARDFKTFADIAGGEKFIITETAMVSSEFAGGSPDYQVWYLRQMFRMINKYRNRIEFFCWFLLYDWPPGGISQAHPTWEIFSSLGLFESDGTPKASYYAWKEEIAKFYH